MKRILIAIPVTSGDWDEVMLKLCTDVANSTTHLEVRHLEKGVDELESALDEGLVVGPLLEILAGESENFDGVIVDCYSDPGVYAARELLQKPVIGIGEAAEYLACAIGNRIGIVTTSERTRFTIEEKSRARGTKDRIVDLRCWGDSPLGLLSNDAHALAGLKEQVNLMRSENAVDTVIIACGSNLALEFNISKEVGLPVVVPEQAAVKVMEAILECNLPVSPAFPSPAHWVKLPSND